jgi:hypothetical protein
VKPALYTWAEANATPPNPRWLTTAHAHPRTRAPAATRRMYAALDVPVSPGTSSSTARSGGGGRMGGAPSAATAQSRADWPPSAQGLTQKSKRVKEGVSGRRHGRRGERGDQVGERETGGGREWETGGGGGVARDV